MNVTYSHVPAGLREPVEEECARQIEKLNRLLKKYAPDLVQLHSSLEKAARRVEYRFTLNLALPTGTLHATGSGADVRKSAKAAFAEIENQVKKHQQKLRKDYVWKRKRSRAALKPGQIG